MEASPNAIVMVDAQGKMLLVNGLTQMLFDYSREELIGQSVEILVPERFRTGHPAHRATFFGAPQAGRRARVGIYSRGVRMARTFWL